MYTIIDIETNGLNHSRGKITEIAIYKHDGKKVIDEYQTLINPEGSIPESIQRLTGISNQMVRNAPKFYEVARDILEFTEGCTFVAHNVNFDYGFVQKEFKDLGYTFSRKKVCTVRQSKLLLPGHRSYSLGKLCADLNIKIGARHRAAGDAEATVKLFEMLLEVDVDLGLKKDPKEQLSKYLHPSLDLNKVLDAPKKTGVYYLYNEQAEVIYVGKSLNIRTRLYNHLRQPKTQKAIQMHQEVADVSFELTGSELAALLHESHEIKRLKPRFNTALKRNSFPYSVYLDQDLFGYQYFKVAKTNPALSALSSYTSSLSAKKHLESVAEEFQLCLGLSDVQKCDRGCIVHSVGKCMGAALCIEPADSYNARMEKAIQYLHPLKNNLLIIDKSNDDDLLWAIQVKQGNFVGMGKFNPEFSNNLSAILDEVKHQDANPDSNHILASHLRRKRVRKVIEIDSFESSEEEILL